MADAFYNNLSYLDSSTSPIEKEQTSFLKLNNFISNKKRGSLYLRGGSNYQVAEGAVLGLNSYSLKNAVNITANNAIPIRFRFNDPDYFVEKYDWTLDTWTEIQTESPSYVTFAANGVASMVQISDMFIIAANRLAKILDPTTGTITRLGGEAPTTAPTVTADSTGITGTVNYAYTFYDPTTGWESSPSPIADAITLTDQGVNLSGMETECDREGVTKKRIYRTEISGDFPLLYLDEIAIEESTYHDDGTALLGDNMPDVADHEPPDDDVYIIEKHEDYLWYVKGDAVYFSKQFDGAYYNLEYFSDARSFNFPFTVKAIRSAPQIGGLLVFGAPGNGIWIITGTSEADFEKRAYMVNEGTNFHHSVTVKDDKVVYWGQKTPRMIADGDIVAAFGAGISEYIEEYTQANFTEAMFVWSLWHEDTEQFIFGFAGENSDQIMAIDENDLVINCIDEFGNFIPILG